MNDFGIYYEERCASASQDQGITELVEALKELGIEASSAQTGGFTMCAYVELPDNKYIYANREGAGIYDEDNYEADLVQFGEYQEASVIAEAVAEYVKKITDPALNCECGYQH
jgi:hypothetical protein